MQLGAAQSAAGIVGTGAVLIVAARAVAGVIQASAVLGAVSLIRTGAILVAGPIYHARARKGRNPNHVQGQCRACYEQDHSKQSNSLHLYPRFFLHPLSYKTVTLCSYYL